MEAAKPSVVGYRWMGEHMKGWVNEGGIKEERARPDTQATELLFASTFRLFSEDGRDCRDGITGHGGARRHPGWLLPAGSLRRGAGHQRLVSASSVGAAPAPADLHLPVPALSSSPQQHSLMDQDSGGPGCGRTPLISPNRIV